MPTSSSASRRAWGTALAALVIASSSGCATIARGTHQEVLIETAPEGATIIVERTGEEHLSPVRLQLQRSRRHQFVISKDGYETQHLYLRSEANAIWWIVDAFSLGIGNILDAVLGGLYDLEPERPYVVLEPAVTAPPSS